MHPALLWKNLPDSTTVLCHLCRQFCRIQPDETGLCGVRINKDGELKTLVMDKVVALNLDPIEKKPLYHFHPGSHSLSLGTMGCNLSCEFCQNYSISMPPKERGPDAVQGEAIAPETIVEKARQVGAASISYTYTEPTIFYELVLATATLAVEAGVKNVLVSNGYMSPQCLESLADVTHAANVDLKAFTEEFYAQRCNASLAPVLENLKHIRKLGWWLEVTTLLIPDANDSDEELRRMARFIHDELGAETPWHISRFHPTYKLTDRGSTPVERLERAYAIGKETGLRFVYVGNVPGHPGDDTFCPDCEALLIKRQGFRVTPGAYAACPQCGRAIPGVAMNALTS